MSERPPLGVMPEWRHKELRLEELDGAIKRYADAGKPVPLNWIVEKYLLDDWLKNCDQPNEEKSQPEIKENKQDLLWTEKEIEDILISALNDRGFGSYKTPHHYIEKSKQSKQPPIAPKTERIEVFGINVLMTEGNGKDCHFYTNGDVPKEKLPLIQQAIEKVLNNDNETHHFLHTQKELDEARIHAFNAARDRIGGFWNDQIKNYTYATLNDYLNTLK